MVLQCANVQPLLGEFRLFSRLNNGTNMATQSPHVQQQKNEFAKEIFHKICEKALKMLDF
jgi:hypothetical protein